MPTGIRPTQDRVREALFSSIAARVPGASVLDLFAGSGAVGLEAWSRGAAAVQVVEADRRVYRGLLENRRTLCGEEPTVRATCCDAFTFLERPHVGAGYDLVFADPPYEAGRDQGYLQKTLRCLGAQPMVNDKGLVVFEQQRETARVTMPGWRLAAAKTYGKTALVYYVPERAEEGTPE